MKKRKIISSYAIQRIGSLIVRGIKKAKYKDLSFGYATIISPKSVFEGHNYILHNSFFHGYLGRYSYIGANCSINAKVGRYCSIADHVCTVAAVHPVSLNVSTYPSFYSNKGVYSFPLNLNEYPEEHPKVEGTNYSVIIGNDVYIGHGVTIMPGVRVGDGAVIGANSTVTKDVAPYAIVAGTPAKLIRYRFSNAHIEKLLKIEWWNKSEEWIHKHCNDYIDINQFMKTIENEEQN